MRLSVTARLGARLRDRAAALAEAAAARAGRDEAPLGALPATSMLRRRGIDIFRGSAGDVPDTRTRKIDEN